MRKNLTFHKQALWYVKHEILRFASNQQPPLCHHDLGLEPCEVDRP